MDLLLAPVFVTAAMLFAVFMISPLLLIFWVRDLIKKKQAKKKPTMMDQWENETNSPRATGNVGQLNVDHHLDS